ncbi:hypothetical protein SAMN02745121_00772 [Nannocystis exedens]|uniref:Uncharacterized protein n=1 Tax=Nannocystis exedens TaxID=54 RepID=A0A1I1TKE9_9BACT|nr:hypothetical protein [Nannocystis exedens]PCC66499.1 hypothetical protein NAEX_09087 [Nannocystis exedens]SFD59111.1 hypothetical protein SAMN02745121_00772 [Nannocystis exedens]
MSRVFTRERCIPWLCARVPLDDEPQEVALSVDELCARIPGRAARGLRLSGAIGLVAAAVVLLTAPRPARAESSAAGSSVRSVVGYTLGGLGLGALAVSRRLHRTSPGLAVLCAGRDADLGPMRLAGLVTTARARLSETAWPKGHVWLISEGPLSAERKAHAAALGVRCFVAVNGRITEV